jgi:hypothetical protein
MKPPIPSWGRQLCGGRRLKLHLPGIIEHACNQALHEVVPHPPVVLVAVPVGRMLHQLAWVHEQVREAAFMLGLATAAAALLPIG